VSKTDKSMKILLVILAIILGIIAVLFLYLLISPIRVILDSKEGYFFLGWNKWLKARIEPDLENLGMEVQIPFWRRKYKFDQMIASRRASKAKTPIKRKKKRFNLNWAKLKKILAQIRVKEFRLICDTDDFIMNAYMIPFMEFLNFKKGYNTHMNFLGKNEIKIEAESRIYNMLKAGIF